MAVSSQCLTTDQNQKKTWWLTNRKIVEKYLRDARTLIATHEHHHIEAALSLIEAAIALSPRLEPALELKARSLLYLRRFKDVADMLQDYIPSLKLSSDVSGSDTSSQHLSRERIKLLSSPDSPSRESSFKCFSVSDLKKKVMASLSKNCEKEGQWRYIVLGQACCHLGLLEDALVLLQTGKRLATAAFRRESISLSDDRFSLLPNPPISADISWTSPPLVSTESDIVTNLLSYIKLLLRRRTAALASLDAGLHSEAIRHFSKILDGRRDAPQSFLAQCYMHRALAYRSAGRIAESIGDCNRTLALDPSNLEALELRATLLESIRCLPDCLHDLEHIKLLYNSILRDRKLPGPAWKRRNFQYRETPGKLCSLSTRIQGLKQRVASGEKTGDVDYYALIGLRRGCSRSELERAHLLLCLRHKPDKALCFIDRCELEDGCDIDSVKDRAKMSALLLYRLLQKGYSSVMAVIKEEEGSEKQRIKAAAALQQAAQAQAQAQAQAMFQVKQSQGSSNESNVELDSSENKGSSPNNSNPSIFQGVFCRDIATVGNLLSQVGFNRPIQVKYEALSC